MNHIKSQIEKEEWKSLRLCLVVRKENRKERKYGEKENQKEIYEIIFPSYVFGMQEGKKISMW